MQDSRSWTPPGGVLGKLVALAEERAAALAPNEAALAARAASAEAVPSFSAALRDRADVAVIAEVKRRSPSKGDIRASINAADQALSYERGGAAAISVLTEADHFGGSIEDLISIRSAATVPLLRKDFIVRRVQILEARAAGASAVLLIARAISPGRLCDLAAIAGEIGLETLVEIRSEIELETALRAGAKVVGVNNRNLETLEIDPSVGKRLVACIAPEIIAVYESGIQSRDDVGAAAAAGADAVLVGSSISASENPESAVRNYTGVARQRRAAGN